MGCLEGSHSLLEAAAAARLEGEGAGEGVEVEAVLEASRLVLASNVATTLSGLQLSGTMIDIYNGIPCGAERVALMDEIWHWTRLCMHL